MTRRGRASLMGIDVRGIEDLVETLDKLDGPEMDAALRNALGKGALIVKKYVKQEAPVGGPGGSTMQFRTRPGDLKKSISAKRGKRSRPPAAFIYPKGTSWYSKFVIRGVPPHNIRFPDQKARGVPKASGNIRHPGARSNPYMARGGDRAEGPALKRWSR